MSLLYCKRTAKTAKWPPLAAVEADEEAKEKVRALLVDSIEGDRAGLGPRIRGGRLSFTQTCVAWLLVSRR